MSQSGKIKELCHRAFFSWSANKLRVYRSRFMYVTVLRNLLVSQQVTCIYILDYQQVTARYAQHRLVGVELV